MKYIKKYEQSEDDLNIFGAVRSLSIREVNKLIIRGVDVNTRNKIGRTPLIYVSSILNRRQDDIIRMIKFLVKNGAELDATDIQNNTALLVAARMNKLKVVSALIMLGADWYIYNKEDKCFLDYLDEDKINELKTRFPEKIDEYLMKKSASKYNL